MNQDEPSSQCSLIGMKHADFNAKCISNVKHLISETITPKKHGQVSLDRKGYQDEPIV